ncbi:MAG: excinuclease ABC subunit UvrC [Caldisericales bacterium]|nr:excinuclease ABC subunit UvrC [Caldisericales bacterium]
MTELEEKVKNLPLKPGVYLFKDPTGKVVYVGKAKCLRDRVSSYLDKSQLLPKVAAMMDHACDLDFIVTYSAHEALVLENNLIKEYQPHYNIKLRDDKEYSFIFVSKEPFPRLGRTRRTDNPNFHYFGPYTRSESLTTNIRTIRQFFPVRTCKLELPEKKCRPCLDYHIGLCLAPCANLTNHEEYQSMVADLLLLLSGKYKKLEETLHKKMTEASASLRFEEAARLRESIKNLSSIVSRQRVVSTELSDRDAFAVFNNENRACVEYMKVRGGRLILDMQMFAGSEDEATPSEFLGAVMQQVYGSHDNIDLPSEILVNVKPEGEKELFEFINQGRELLRQIKIVQPKRGDKVQLLKMAETNAKHHLSEHMRRETLALGKNAIIQLQEALGLKKPPFLIEGYDIANIQGKGAVGSQVSFKDGRPNKKGYRIYKIKTKDTPDDYAMMRETLERRRTHWDDEEFAQKPDLLLIDGGMGQLNVALDVFKGIDVEIASLAKEEELVMRKGMEPIRLPETSPALRLLQQIRDESHRFAGKHFRTQHKKLSGLD